MTITKVTQESIVDLLAMPGAAEIDFEPARLGGRLHRRSCPR